ncbi:MAG: hypothetical protein M1839_005180 [Geoglossum umbratile]|nr:MAG: hypothetical protein M1839_005180 [Geoglossum umbratile]
MATPRLTFLYPNLFSSLHRAYKPLAQGPIPAAHHFHCTSRHRIPANRHGSAVEPLPTGIGVPPLALRRTDKARGEDADGGKDSGAEVVKETAGKEPKNGQEMEQTSSTPTGGPQPTSTTEPDASLDNVLLPNSSTLQSPSHTPPHHPRPPSPHHFDTYTLVDRLTTSNLSPPLALTTMEAIDALLSHHLAHTQSTHITPSHLSNQSYLFTTLLSELKHEILHTRHLEATKQRSERARLQHEADLLSQRLTQDLVMLRDEMRGMFNDRKMAVRLDQREVERKIQELNYKITVMLGSDIKSEVEGLRWVLTRRAAMAIATMAFLILGSLRYSSYHAHIQQQQQRQQQQPQSKQQPNPHPGRESSETPVESTE